MTYGWNFLPTASSARSSRSSPARSSSLPALKLSVEYLILLTLAISSVIIGVFTTFPQLGGTYGLISLPAAESVRLDHAAARATG